MAASEWYKVVGGSALGRTKLACSLTQAGRRMRHPIQSDGVSATGLQPVCPIWSLLRAHRLKPYCMNACGTQWEADTNERRIYAASC